MNHKITGHKGTKVFSRKKIYIPTPSLRKRFLVPVVGCIVIAIPPK